MYRLGPGNGSLTVHTARAGMVARAGHDLVLEAERWDASVSASGVRATVDARSLQVREGHGGVMPLSDSDREEIRRNLQRKVLSIDEHPEITFVSTAVDTTDEHRWQVAGELTITGRTASVELPIEFEPGPDGTRLNMKVTIAQTNFGIKPYSALMGALKVADAVEIRAEARVRESQP